MNESTTVEEAAHAVEEVIGPGRTGIKSVNLWSSYGGTQTASLMLPIAAAKELLKRESSR